MNKIRTWLNSEKIMTAVLILMFVIQPVIELDYLAYSFLDQFGLPRPSTIIRYLLIPLFVLWTFYLRDRNRKKTFVFAGIYGVCLLAYFVLHVRQGAQIYKSLYLTPNFFFQLSKEVIYFLTLLIPYGVIYCVYQNRITERVVKWITVSLSCLTSIPVVVGDLFVFGMSTYSGYTQAPFLSWFFEIYADPGRIHPRQLASKFFFEEGNTTGILLFMILPLLYLFFHRSTSKNERVALGSLIAVHSLSMIIISTRVAALGSAAVPVLFLILYLFCSLVLKQFRVEKSTVTLCLSMVVMCGCILPFSPAIVNQNINVENTAILLQDDYLRQEVGASLENTTELKNDDYYRYMFESYGIEANLMASVPGQYYMEWYHYTADPKFWVDVMSLPLEQRVNGRQIEKIFTDYKWNELSQAQKVLGMGYSTFNNGSILLERDFAQQVYTMGYAGAVLTVLPWILITLFGGVAVLVGWKKYLRLDVMVYALALCAGLASSYISGHTIDELLSSLFMALLVGVLLNAIRKPEKK